LPVNVANISNKFSEIFGLNQEVKVDKIEHPNLFSNHSEHFLWWNISENNWLNNVNDALNLIIEEGFHLSDTVILLPNKNYGFQIIDFFLMKNIPVNHVFEEGEDKKSHRHKKAFWMGDSRLKISTIHSFKGWEVLNVILFISNSIIGALNLNDSVVYTAITRARQNLIVINANQRYWNFGENLDKTW